MSAGLRPRHASLPQRMAALTIDLALAMLAVAGIAAVLPASLPDAAMMALSTLPAVLYLLLRDGLPNGQSLGKRLLRIRVVDADGAPCGLLRSVVRNLLLVTLATVVTLLLEYLFCWMSRYRRLGDIVANTAVVTTTMFASHHPQADAG